MKTVTPVTAQRKTPRLLYAAGLAIVVAGAIVAAQSYSSVEKVQEFYTVEVRGLRTAGELALQMQEGRRTVIYGLTTEDPNQQLTYIDEARTAGDVVADLEKQLSSSRLDSGSRKALESLSASWRTYLGLRDQIIASILLGQGKQGLSLDLKEAHPAFERVKADFTRLQGELDRSAAEQLRHVTTTLNRTMLEIALLLIGMLFFLKTAASNIERRRIVGTLREINDQLQSTQRDLRDRESRLRALFDNVIDAIITFDERGVIGSANPATEKLFGYEISALMGHNIRLLIPSASGEANIGDILNTELTGSPDEIKIQPSICVGGEVNGLRRDGTPFPLDMTVSEVMTDGRRTFVGILRDVTERRRAEEALHESRRQLMDVTANIPGAVFQMQRVKHSGSRFLFISDGIKEINGRNAAEILGNPQLMMECVHGDDLSLVENGLRTALRAGTTFKCTYRVQRDGEIRWLAASAVPQTQAMGEPKWNGVIVDVTSSKEAESKLAEYAEQLVEVAARAEAATKAKSEFLATMSHEIRTPMNGVLGMTGLLLETPLSSEQKDCAETIRSSGEALLGIINDILDFSKIEAGKLDLEYCPFDLRPVVEDALEVVAPLAQKKKTELCAPMEDSVPPGLVGDSSRLRQVLLNLLSNAIKFTEGGEVVLSVTREQTLDQDSVRVRFEVRDTGIGISPEVQKKLFQSFSQADSSTTRRFGGTGLGLAICKKLVELMGGEIGLRSVPGSGSTFWFTVPFKIATETIAVPAAAENLRNRRVLAVDDNGTNRSVLKQQLSTIGMMVTCASSGQEGLEELILAARQGRPYELGILDLHMPVMNGLMLAKEIRREATVRSLPLMMLTSDRDRDEAATARELDVKIFLVKPVKQANLIRAVGEMFGAPPSQAQNSQVSDGRKLDARILVVEDNATNQKVIVLRLEKLGCSTFVANNGAEAVEAAAANRFDAILMDCQMPVMDGFEATAQIRKKGGSRVPIIALTANAMDGERERCLEAGMDDYLSKPVRAEELLKKLQYWAGSKNDSNASPAEKEKPADTGTRQSLDRFIADMQEDGLDRSEALSILDSFLATSPAFMNQVQEAVQNQDGPLLAHAAHTMKGSCASMGLSALADFATQIEQAGQAQLWKGANEQFSLALSAYQETRQSVAEILSTP